MLVLTRKIDERIQIGDAIEVVVLSVQGSRVRLGIQAPREISVARTEANRFSDERSLECELELAGCAQ